MASHVPVEIVTLTFPSTLSHEDELLFDNQSDHCKHAGPPIAHVWTIPHSREDTYTLQECVVVFNWESLDETKSDEVSLFNSGSLPLRIEASEGLEIVLYMRL